jgi:hypothetical protein
MNKRIVNVARHEVNLEEAYERVKGDWAGLAEDQLLKVNLDIAGAVKTMLGALPEVKAQRDRLAALPAFDVAAFDKLEDYVLALSCVQAQYVMATQPPDDLAELNASAIALRERLTLDAKALVNRGLFDARKMAALSGNTGYRNVGTDLQSLGLALKAVWSDIQGKSGIELEELTAATQIGTSLQRIAGVREQAPVILASLVEERMRAFTLVIKVWEEARAGIIYVRRAQEDADSIAPNLYTGKALRTKASEPDEAVVDGGGTPAVGTPAAGAPAVGASSGGTSPFSGTSGAALTSAEISKKGPFVS